MAIVYPEREPGRVSSDCEPANELEVRRPSRFSAESRISDVLIHFAVRNPQSAIENAVYA